MRDPKDLHASILDQSERRISQTIDDSNPQLLFYLKALTGDPSPLCRHTQNSYGLLISFSCIPLCFQYLFHLHVYIYIPLDGYGYCIFQLLEVQFYFTGSLIPTNCMQRRIPKIISYVAGHVYPVHTSIVHVPMIHHPPTSIDLQFSSGWKTSFNK